MAYLLRDGVALYYEVHGEGEPILLSHGFLATGAMWAGQLPMLTRRHKVIVWDMRGHGRTDSPADPAAYSEAATVADMSAILDAVGVQRAIIGGHSLGGYMSLAFHRDHRARVSALLLCGTGPGYRKDDARAAWNKIAVQFGEHIEKQGLSASGHSAEMRLTDHKSVHGLVCAARGMLTQRDASVLNTLPDINAPTFMSVGSDDKSYLDGMRYMAGKIAGAELHVFEGAGHAANIDQPQAFNAKLEAFLAKRSG